MTQLVTTGYWKRSLTMALARWRRARISRRSETSYLSIVFDVSSSCKAAKMLGLFPYGRVVQWWTSEMTVMRKSLVLVLAVAVHDRDSGCGLTMRSGLRLDS